MRVFARNETYHPRSTTLMAVGALAIVTGLGLSAPVEKIAERDAAHAALRDAFVWVACIDAGVLDPDLDPKELGASVARRIDQAFVLRTGRRAAELTLLAPSDYQLLGRSMIATAAPGARLSLCADAKARALSVMRASPGAACPRSSCA